MLAMQRQAEAHFEEDEPLAEPQRVAMSRAELELYVRQGRPTGLLLRSVAILKGMTAESVAGASGMPVKLVVSIFDDHGAGALKRGAIKRMATVLGIDLGEMKLASSRVHVFNLARIPGGYNSKAARQIVRAVGLLARGATVAELKVGKGLKSLMWRRRMHVVQTGSFRALFIGSRARKFALDSLPSASWVCGDRASSIVPVENAELMKLLIARDLTEGEFDELFQGPHAVTWDDIHVASRVNGVSKSTLLHFIEFRAQEQDATEEEAERLAFSEPRTSLTLVHNDNRSSNAD